MDSEKLFQVGEFIEKFNTLTGQELPCGPIYQSVGLEKHTRRRHPDLIARLQDIPAVILSPDYVGTHPSEAKSIELVKYIDANVMVCIKLDQKNDYLYVASVYEITESKLQNRLRSGRSKVY